MNNGAGIHPDEGRLMLYLDGELPEREQREIKQHLDACWNCRMYADRMHNTMVEYARYRELAGVPEPPSEWKDLTGDFRRLEREIPSRQRWPRVSRVVWFAGVISAAAATAWFTIPKEAAAPVVAPVPMRESRPAPRVMAPEPVGRPEVRVPAPRASLSDELAVISRLHAIRADLGEPVEVIRSNDGQLVVSGFGLSARREGAVREAVQDVPGVLVRFENPESRAVDTGGAGRDAAPTTDRVRTAVIGLHGRADRAGRVHERGAGCERPAFDARTGATEVGRAI